jgi:hypothetical protein
MVPGRGRIVRRVTLPGPVERDTGAIDDRPRSVYELMTRRMLEELRESLNEVKTRVNTLLWLVIGAVLMELLMKVFR